MDSITNLAKLLILESYQNEDSLGNCISQVGNWVDEFIIWLKQTKPELINEVLKFCEDNETDLENVLMYQPYPDSKFDASLLLGWAEWILTDKEKQEELGDELYNYMYWREEPADFYGWINTGINSSIQLPRSPEDVVELCKEFWPEKIWKTGHKILMP
jgi:hypothetical protein